MNTLDYLEATQYLMQATLDDPILHLASAAIWLDPLCLQSDTDPLEEMYDYDEVDDLQTALYISRSCFPSLYADAVSGLHDDLTDHQITQGIREGISAQGIPDFDAAYAYGIPLPACGIDPLDADTLEPHRGRIEPLYELFGIQFDDYNTHIPPDTYHIALAVAFSLDETLRQQNPAFEQLYWLLGWAFGMTGNTSVDATWDMLADYPPLDWTPDNVAFARVIIAECDEIMTAALAGLDDFQADASLCSLLSNNITIARNKLSQRPQQPISEDNPNPFNLVWTT